MDRATAQILLNIGNSVEEALADLKAIKQILSAKGLADPWELQRQHSVNRQLLDQAPQWREFQETVKRILDTNLVH